ncbi:MAG: TAXI family TRAP transporter solute-binding subunit [Desulfarculus sp.]|nr:TAXI family TRAP transporter solute-binding subunit [Desulfarculus sp.]
MKKMLALLFTLGLVSSLAGGALAALEHPEIAFCTGEPGAIFNTLGEAMVSVLKKEIPGRKFAVVTTSGSNINCKQVGMANREIGFTQEETLRMAIKGGNRKAGFDASLPNIRVVSRLHSHFIHVMVRNDAGIKNLSDLKGKKIALGPAGSGSAAVVGSLLESAGFTSKDLSGTSYSPVAGYASKLQSKQLDAAIVVQGLQSQLVAKALASGAVLLPVTPEASQNMAATNDSYHPNSIPKGTYPGQDQDVPTMATSIFLITHAGVDNQIVYSITKTLYSEGMANAHPLLKQLSLQKAAQNPPVALHPGAERFYKEKGVIK